MRMTVEEYRETAGNLRELHELRIEDLKAEFLKQNTKFKIGDIIESTSWEGVYRVVRCTTSMFIDPPMPVYVCEKLTQKMQPYKDDKAYFLDQNCVKGLYNATNK